MCLHVLTKTLPLKFIGVALRLLNSQWKMHHCDVVPSSFNTLCSLQAPQYFTNFALLSPPTHFTRAPPLPALPEQQVDDPPCNLQMSWQESYSTRSRVQDVRLRYRSRLQSYQRGRVTCMVLRNRKWRLTYS